MCIFFTIAYWHFIKIPFKLFHILQIVKKVLCIISSVMKRQRDSEIVCGDELFWPSCAGFLDSTWRSKVFITTLDFNKVIIFPLVTPIERRKFVSELIISDTSIVALPSQPTSTAHLPPTPWCCCCYCPSPRPPSPSCCCSCPPTTPCWPSRWPSSSPPRSCPSSSSPPTTTMISKSKIKLCVKHSVFKNYFI